MASATRFSPQEKLAKSQVLACQDHHRQTFPSLLDLRSEEGLQRMG